MRANVNIKGIQMNRYEMKNIHYADDLWSALEPNENNIREAFMELERFSRFSGLTINYGKSVAKIIGPLKKTNARLYTLKPLFWSEGPIKILGSVVDTDKDKINVENFDRLLDDIEHRLSNWTNRSLTLIGKIVVLNTLIASLFVHKFMALPTSKQEFFSKYKSIVTYFLWNGKVAKVRYDKLVQRLDRGGLKLVDLETKNHALKAAWIIRWQKNNNLQKPEMDWLYINLPIGNQTIWAVSLNEKDILKHFHKQGNLDMGVEIWHSWSVMMHQPDFDQVMFEHTPLFYNSCIKRVNQPFFHNKLVPSNVNTLRDIYDEMGECFLTYEQLVEKYGVLPYDVLFYRSMVASIPALWKGQLAEVRLQEPIDDRVGMLSKRKGNSLTSLFYWERIDTRFIYHDTAKMRWETELHVMIEEDKWQNGFLQIMAVTRSTKLRYFQYRMLNKIIVTNHRRNKWDPPISPLCYFCNDNVETVMHLLYYCPKICGLWNALEKWTRYYMDIVIDIQPLMILMNNYAGKGKQLINMYILVMKQFIYASKCLEEIPTFNKFIERVNHWNNVEKLGIETYNQWKKYHIKWKLRFEIM